MKSAVGWYAQDAYEQAGTTVSEKELWDQSVQSMLLIQVEAIVLQEVTKERCAT